MSTAILKLSENGELQRIHDKWVTNKMCSPTEEKLEYERLHLSSFWGLFLISAVASVLAILVYLSITFYQYVHEEHRNRTIKNFLSYINNIKITKTNPTRSQCQRSNSSISSFDTWLSSIMCLCLVETTIIAVGDRSVLTKFILLVGLIVVKSSY